MPSAVASPALDRLRPDAETREDAIVGGIHDDRRDAGEVHILRLHDTERGACRDARIDRAAARLQKTSRGQATACRLSSANNLEATIWGGLLPAFCGLSIGD